MVKSKKTMAAIALSATMATCGIAAIGFAKMEHADALTSTHYSTSAFADVGKKDIQGQMILVTGAKISASNPLSLPLTGVPQGQYYLSVNFSGIPSGQYFDVVATVGDEAFYLLTDFGTTTASAAGVIRTSKADDTIILSVNTPTELTVDVYLEDLYIGESNNYQLNGVQLTNVDTAIELQSLSAGKYTISVDLGAQVLGEDASIIAETDNEEAAPVVLVKQGFFETYTGTLDLSASTATLYLRTTNPVPLNVSITLEKQAVIDPLPATAVTLETWMPVTYSYSVTEPGYYKINYTSTDTKAVVETTFKTNATDFEGLTVVGDNFPLYMEADTTYYFTVTLTDATENTASVTFTVTDWAAPTITAGDIFYVPVTSATSKEAEIDLDLADNTYNLSITDVPFTYVENNYVISAFFTATAPTQSVALNRDNSFAASVELKGATKVHFTTTAPTDTVVGISFVVPEERKELVIGALTDIEVPGKVGTEQYGSATYYVTAPTLPEGQTFDWLGYYDIVLSTLTSQNIEVTTTYSDIPAVLRGDSVGGFAIRYEGEFALIFRNYGAEAATFKATVTKALSDLSIDLGVETDVTVPAESLTVRYLENLVQGNYSFTVTAADESTDLQNITVYVDGEEFALENGKATLNVSYTQDSNGLITVMFKNTGATDANLKVTVTPQNVMMLGTPVTISTTGYDYYAAYNINLAAGTYVLALNLPEGMNVSVLVGNTEIVTYGNTAGILNVTEDNAGYFGLRFNFYYGTGKDVDVQAIIYRFDEQNTLALDTPKTISFAATDIATTYKINLTAGRYSITLQDGVEIAVNGLVTTNGLFDIVAENETVYITFINKTATAKTFNVTVHQTDSYFLELGVFKDITLSGYETRTYYITNITAGDYSIRIDSNVIQVMFNGQEIIASGSYAGTFTVTENGTIAITFNSYSFEEVTFSAYVA